MEPSILSQNDGASPVSNRNFWIASFSNLSTAFNLININLAHVIMENQYCREVDPVIDCSTQVSVAGTACLVGAITGQLTFGFIGDCLGRPRALQLTMALSIFGALISAFAVPVGGNGASIFSVIAATRFVLGIGVGGVYPLSATLSAESANEATRGKNVALVFSMQGIGNVAVPVVGLIFLKIFGTPAMRTANDQALPGISWRCLLGIGALPGILLAPFKATSSAPAIPSITATPVPQVTLLQALSTARYWPKIIGCAGGWFIFDITFYGNTLFAPTILAQIFEVPKNATGTAGNTLQTNLCYQLFILAIIGLPGYYVSVFTMDRLGRKNIQLQGFFMMAMLYAVLALWIDDLPDWILLLVYGLTYFFSNFGPNATTFILPSETFPFEVRSTLNGFSAAMGKLGATIGSSAFKPIVDGAGPSVCFWLCSGCAVCGVLVTLVFVEDRRGKGMAGNSFLQVDREKSTENQEAGLVANGGLGPRAVETVVSMQ